MRLGPPRPVRRRRLHQPQHLRLRLRSCRPRLRCRALPHSHPPHRSYTRLHRTEADPAQARDHLAKARALIHATGYHRRDDDLARLEASLA